MRRIVAYLATSADGYIARPDGGIEWLDRPHPPGDYGMREFLSSIDAIVWGRTTYDIGVKLGGPGGGFGTAYRHYVFTHHPPAPAAGVTFVSEPPGEFARRVRAEPGKDLWMMGGATIIGAFLDAGAIDAFVITVVPVLIGEGIPIIAPRHRNVPLALRSAQPFPDGVVQLHYDVGAAP